MQRTTLSLTLLLITARLAGAHSEAVKLDPFVLRDAGGSLVTLAGSEASDIGTVLAFTSVECPIARLYAPRLARLHAEYRGEGIRFLGIDPAYQDEPEEIRERAAKVGITFPILCDPLQVVTSTLGVTRTTEVFLLDREYRVLYRGALDDQYSYGAARPSPQNEYLVEAIEALIAREDVEHPVTEAPGCLIADARSSEFLKVTYHKDIARLLQENCQDCHRPGQIGPMSLLTYEDAASWAPMIAEVVENRRMPPWHADLEYGHFLNQRIMSETDRALLAHWAGIGMPEGDPADGPPARVFDESEWVLNTPDFVVELPDEQTIPAEGVVDYRYVVIDPQLTEDRWVQSIEIQPTNREVTHHVLILLIPPGISARQFFASQGEDFVELGYFAVQVPGCRPNIFPQGMGKRLPAGAKLLCQLHYTPNGVEARDRTRVGLTWCNEAPEFEVLTRGVYNPRIRIPPRDGNAMFHARHTFDQPVRLLSMFPHMHTRGKSFRIELIGEDQDTVLLNVPRYDFNWQNFYRLAQPVPIAEGEVLFVTAAYDNSTGNPFNPDPDATVFWGDQTFEEMMIGYIDYYLEPDADAPGTE